MFCAEMRYETAEGVTVCVVFAGTARHHGLANICESLVIL